MKDQIRAEFEQQFPLPKGVTFDGDHYVADPAVMGAFQNATIWSHMYRGWKSRDNAGVTPSEDGREVAAFHEEVNAAVGDAYHDEISRTDAVNHIVAQHSRIVAARDAEIARLKNQLAAEKKWYDDEIDELLAQPAHQVGGDEREAVLQIFADNAECSEKGDEGGYVIVHDHHALTIADKLRAVFAQNAAAQGDNHE